MAVEFKYNDEGVLETWKDGKKIGNVVSMGDMTNEPDSAIARFRKRRKDRLDARFDEEPDSWITVNGNHIPLDEDKNPIGGQKKALGVGSDKPKHKTVQGKDIRKTIKKKPDGLYPGIRDVIGQQGFDGKPQVVDAGEFKRALKESPYIMQRAYSAPSQEILDEYRESLYDGDWYVDCSGGAQYGMGMYCVVDKADKIGDYSETNLNRYKGGYKKPFYYVETMTLTPDARVADRHEIENELEEAREKIYKAKVDAYEKNGIKVRGFTPDEDYWLIERPNTFYSEDNEEHLKNTGLSLGGRTKEELARIREEVQKARNSVGEYTLMVANMDEGTYAAMVGYDALYTDQDKFAGDFLIVLNRTKLIIKKPDNWKRG